MGDRGKKRTWQGGMFERDRTSERGVKGFFPGLHGGEIKARRDLKRTNSSYGGPFGKRGQLATNFLTKVLA